MSLQADMENKYFDNWLGEGLDNIGECVQIEIQYLTCIQHALLMSQDYLTSEKSQGLWATVQETFLEECVSSPVKSRQNSSSTSANSDIDSPLGTHSVDNFACSYQPRNNNQIRLKYMEKLQGAGLLCQRPRKKCHHLIIFDWDDTLFCTSFLANNRIEHASQLTPPLAAKIKEMDYKITKLLNTALELAIVHIVTNSMTGWVQYCARSFLPQTSKIIQNFKIKVVSARASYEDIYPGDPLKWKTECFRDLLYPIEKRTVALNFVCIGDSTFQMEAAEKGSTEFETRFVKTIKLKEKPKIDDLCKQVQLVEERLRQIMKQTKGLSIKLQKR